MQTFIRTNQWVCALAVAAFVAIPTAAAAQTITTNDIQRLQDDVYQASSDLTRLRSTSPDSASRLQADLDELRDEVIYLKVRLRREGSVPRAEYTDVRDRLQALRAEARGEGTERKGTWTGGSTGATRGTGSSAGTSSSDRGGYGDTRSQGTSAIPAGQELDVRLQTQISSSTAQVEDRFEATTVADLYRGNEVLIPAGSVLRGVIRTVQRASRTDRKG